MTKKSNTCIIAFKNRRGKITMAGDRMVTYEDTYQQVMNTPKIMARDGLLLGGCGELSILSDFLYSVKIPQKKGLSTREFMQTKVKPQIERMLQGHGFVNEHGQIYVDDIHASSFMIGIENEIWSIDIEKTKIAIDIISSNIAAIGCGKLSALSLLTYFRNIRKDISHGDIKNIFDVVGSLMPGCSKEFDIIEGV